MHTASFQLVASALPSHRVKSHWFHLFLVIGSPPCLAEFWLQDFADEQGQVARLVHRLSSPDPATQFAILQAARNRCVESSHSSLCSRNACLLHVSRSRTACTCQRAALVAGLRIWLFSTA